MEGKREPTIDLKVLIISLSIREWIDAFSEFLDLLLSALFTCVTGAIPSIP